MEDLVKQLSEKANEIFQDIPGMCRIVLYRLQDGVRCTLEYSDEDFNFKIGDGKVVERKVDIEP